MTSGSEKVLTKMNRCAKGNIEVIEKVNYINFEQKVAGGQGLEPWITGPEPVVLPLYYPPVKKIEI